MSEAIAAPPGAALAAAAVATLAGFAGTIAVRSLARRFGIVSAPNPLIPQHTRPVAYLGGLGVALGIGAGLLTLRLLGGSAPLGLAAPALLYLGLGLADDLMVLRPALKFALQGSVAAIAVALGASVSLTGVAPVDQGLSWLWIAALVNAFNLTDVCDGLLAALGVVVFTSVALLDPTLRGAALAVAGACLGFLFLNLPPASIFLGDAGSHLLGFLAAAFTLESAARTGGSPSLTLVAGALVVGVPVFEMVFLIVVRLRKRLAWWKGSPDHFALRLQVAGLSRRRTVAMACVVAGLWAACGLALPRLEPAGVTTVVAGVLLSAAGAAVWLWRHEVPRRAVEDAGGSTA